MPAYHSRFVEETYPEVCSCALCPLKTEIKGPAALAPADAEDIIDETLNFFRANVLFRNFDVRGGADRTLIYLTLYTVQCLVKCEKIEDKPTALREMKNLATKTFLCPGDVGWPLGGLFPAPKNKAETGMRCNHTHCLFLILPNFSIFSLLQINSEPISNKHAMNLECVYSICCFILMVQKTNGGKLFQNVDLWEKNSTISKTCQPAIVRNKQW